MQSVKSYDQEILRVKGELDKWKERRAYSREPIPDYLWDQILPLAKTHRIHEISKGCGVSFDTIKSHLPQNKKAKTKKIKFLALNKLSPVSLEQGIRVSVSNDKIPGLRMDLSSASVESIAQVLKKVLC